MSNNAIRPDAQGFDEIRIITVPRYKESELSGDEWRISASIQFWRKGEIVCVGGGAANIEAAVTMLGGEYLRALDNANGFYAGDGVHCDQESCPELATVRYRMKAEYCRQGHRSIPSTPTFRHFCERHKIRGDCGCDDADSNYEKVPLK